MVFSLYLAAAYGVSSKNTVCSAGISVDRRL